ncbi:MAG: hypothetical protein ACO1NS_10825 [Daejeonella sp.]
MKSTGILFIALLVLVSCKPKTGDTVNQNLRQQNFDLKKENDSLRSAIEKAARTFEGDTIQKMPEISNPEPHPTLAGRHDLTLQWISWEKPGSVIITESRDGWYTIKGSQTGEKDSYLRVNGRIRPLNQRELEFDGTIEYNAHLITTGEPCVRTGKQLFKATGTRKYWRLQNMLSCDGTTTDYVDIYF